MEPTILVTGASGTVGSSVLSSLLKFPVHVRAALHRNIGSEAHARVETVKFDFTDPATFDAALNNAEGLFLLPPSVASGHAQVLPFLEYLKENAPSLRHIVVITAMGVKPNDGSPYGHIETLVEEIGIPYTILRPNWFMQNFNTYFLDGVLIGELSLPAGEAPTSFIDTRDIGEAAAKVLAEDSYHWETLTLTGWQSLTYREAAAALSEQLGREIKYIPVTAQAMRNALKGQGWDQDSMDEMLDLFEAVRNGKFAPLTQDIAKVLGRAPRTLEQYITDYKEHLTKNAHVG